MAFASGELMREKVSLLKSNRGASLVLVSAFCVIIIGIAVTLTVIGSLLLSKAGKVKSQGQAYELATSLQFRLEELILNEIPSAGVTPGHKSVIDLDSFITSPATSGEIVNLSGFDSIPDSSVVAIIEKKDSGEGVYYTLTVTAKAAGETYITETDYSGNATMGYERR